MGGGLADGFRSWLVCHWKYISDICIGVCPLSPGYESEDRAKNHVIKRKVDQVHPVGSAHAVSVNLKPRLRKSVWVFSKRKKVSPCRPLPPWSFVGNGGTTLQVGVSPGTTKKPSASHSSGVGLVETSWKSLSGRERRCLM